MQKLYYSITEVGKEVDEESHILRYWEKEFEQLNPRKNSGGNRIYSEDDLEVIKNIKRLIREERLSLKAAKIKIQEMYSGTDNNIPESDDSNNNNISLSNVELIKLRSILQDVSDFLKKQV